MTHRFPRRVLVADLVRGGIGLLVTGGPVIAADLPMVANVILGVLALVFGLFVVHVARRFGYRVESDATGLAVHPGGVRLDWSGIEGLALAHYAVRRDSGEGWMELTLSGGGRRLRIDSRIESFSALAEPAVAAAYERGLELDATTVANLAVLGHADGKKRSAPHPGGGSGA